MAVRFALALIKHCTCPERVLRSRMPRISSKLTVCALAFLVLPFQGKGQSVALSNQALRDVLLKRNDEFMSAWKRHDPARMAAAFDPEFLSVGGRSMTAGLDATMKGLLGCTLTSYHIPDSRLLQLSPTMAILITRQQQEISCSGHPAPPVVDTTDTYVKRNGRWVIIMHTEAVPETP